MIRLFRVSIPVGVLTLLFSEIVLTSGCFLLAAYWYFGTDILEFFVDEGGLIRTALVVTSIILGMHFSDLYTRIHVKSRVRLLRDLSQVIGAALLAQGLIAYATPTLRLGRGIMLVGTIMSFLALLAVRISGSLLVLSLLPWLRELARRGLYCNDRLTFNLFCTHVISFYLLPMAIGWGRSNRYSSLLFFAAPFFATAVAGIAFWAERSMKQLLVSARSRVAV
jgi:hypothetical protein